jgi:F420-dependent oxidoreductase-like protein
MIEGQEGVTWDDWLALAGASEKHGVETLFRSDHYLSQSGPETHGSLDAWTTIAALAARTSKLRLGTLVSPVTFRHPSVLAKAAATADHVSGGRVELGIGGGWMVPEHDAYGFPFPETSERLELLAEQLEIVHRQWTEERFDFEGAHFRLKGCTALPKPVQSPRPPILVGGSARPGTVRPAARFADEYNIVFPSVDGFRKRRERIRELCEEESRDPDSLSLSLMIGCVVGEDDREATEKVRGLYELRPRDSSFEEFERGYRGRALVGGVDEMAEQLRAYGEAGADRVMLQHLQHRELDTVTLIGRRLVPAVL